MYLESEDFKTLWQLAIAWAGYNPDRIDENNLPGEVQLNLKRLAAAILRRALSARTKKTAILYDDGFLDYLFDIHHLMRLLRCRSGKSFDKEYLSSIFIRRGEFLRWCEHEKYPGTDFWVLTQITSTARANNRPKNEIEDKAVCRAIAMAYWDIDPNIHPAHMAESRAITQYGNGGLYDINTIKDWISDLDPLKKERNPGRPKKITYKINLETGALPAEFPIK